MPESPSRAPKNRSHVGPYSKPNTLAKLDGRRREAKLMKDTVAELTAHVGGKPSTVQRRLIHRAAVLALRLAMMDAKAPDGMMSERDAREYLCWNNAYVRTLREIDAGATGEKPESPDDILREIHSRFGKRTDTEGAE